MERGTRVSVECGCGRTVVGNRSEGSLDCECGAVYAVTVTTLREAGQRA